MGIFKYNNRLKKWFLSLVDFFLDVRFLGVLGKKVFSMGMVINFM